MAASSPSPPLKAVLERVQATAERSGENVEEIRVVAASKTKPVSSLPAVPNLACVQTVDDEKIANLLDRAVENVGRKPLKVFVQVNTSGETSKFGIEPAQCVDLVKHITNFPNPEFCGLMTISMLNYSSTPRKL